MGAPGFRRASSGLHPLVRVEAQPGIVGMDARVGLTLAEGAALIHPMLRRILLGSESDAQSFASPDVGSLGMRRITDVPTKMRP
jgi:hypothetical protein